jgi:hypothetical protein
VYRSSVMLHASVRTISKSWLMSHTLLQGRARYIDVDVFFKNCKWRSKIGKVSGCLKDPTFAVTITRKELWNAIEAAILCIDMIL